MPDGRPGDLPVDCLQIDPAPGSERRHPGHHRIQVAEISRPDVPRREREFQKAFARFPVEGDALPAFFRITV